MIAEFVLKSDHLVEFRWLSYTSTSKKGHFDGLSKLAALSRTSKQLKAEISGLMWKVNVFHFDKYLDLGSPFDYRDDFTGPNTVEVRIREAAEFFARKIPSRQIGGIRLGLKVHKTAATYGDAFLITLLGNVSDVANILPGCKWGMHDLSWKFRGWVDKSLCEQSVKDFHDLGKASEEMLARNEVAGVKRKWKISNHLQSYSQGDKAEAHRRRSERNGKVN